MYKKIFYLFFIILFVSSCGVGDSIKRGMTNQKSLSTDEFLVKKKDPLVMPPKWQDLPEPGRGMKSGDQVEEVSDIEELIQVNKNQESSINLEQGSGNLEESVLKKIKQK